MAVNELVSPSPSTWKVVIQDLMQPAVISMLFLGFAAGIPILLIFSSLSLWLGEAGIEKKTVTYFSLAALGYSSKFIWAPLIDTLPIPTLTTLLGRRRAWLLVSQLMVIGAICWMASTDPALGQDSLTLMAYAAVFLGFSSATQDIVLDAYRIEAAEPRLQAMMSAVYVAGYRIGMVVAGAGALYLAAQFGTTKEAYQYTSWQWTYLIMAGVMLIGVVTTLLVKEPEPNKTRTYTYLVSDYIRLIVLFIAGLIALILFYSYVFSFPSVNDYVLSFLIGSARLILALLSAMGIGWILVILGLVNKQMAYETWIAPLLDFFRRYRWRVACLLLMLVGFYRISDIVLGVMSNVFYQELGFSKIDIALAVKTMGLWLTILGGFVGGIFVTRFGVMRMLMLGAILSAATNLLFVWLNIVGRDLTVMYFVVGADNFVAGLASAAFIAFLSSLTNISFTAGQYAIFSSLMTLLPKVFGAYSGGIVENIGYSGFFSLTAVIGVPVILLVWLVGQHLNVK